MSAWLLARLTLTIRAPWSTAQRMPAPMLPRDGSLAAGGHADGHDRAGPAVAGDADAVVALGADDRSRPRCRGRSRRRCCVSPPRMSQPGHDVGHVRLRRRREAGVDDGDHDARVAGRVLPEVGGPGQARPPFLGPERVVRVGEPAPGAGHGAASSEEDEQNQAEAPHGGRTVDASPRNRLAPAAAFCGRTARPGGREAETSC